MTLERHCSELDRLDYWYSSRAIRDLPVGQINLSELTSTILANGKHHG